MQRVPPTAIDDELARASDEELAARAAREGSDGVAFTALVDRHRERVWRVCWRLMGSQHDAEDAAQEVFVRLFFERGRFAGRSRYSTWLHGVALRTCLTMRRSRSRRRLRETTELPAAAAGPDASPAIPARGGGPEAAVDAVLDVERLLQGLDEEDRALVLMRFAEGHDYDELAEIFAASAPALRMRISRIRERLARAGAEEPSAVGDVRPS
jgi:RNA polymerase sigma-70 factor (ECF subfamily)